jgi:hypothetical protein
MDTAPEEYIGSLGCELESADGADNKGDREQYRNRD